MSHIAVDMSHIAAIFDISLQYVTYRCNVLHIVAICHIAVEMSNRGKICPYKKKKMF